MGTQAENKLKHLNGKFLHNDFHVKQFLLREFTFAVNIYYDLKNIFFYKIMEFYMIHFLYITENIEIKRY